MKKVIFSEVMDKEDSNGAPWTELEYDDFHVAVYKDSYPVTEGHRLFVPKYNNVDVLKDAFNDAVDRGLKGMLDGEWDGFNIGLNVGEVAGQTCSWPHVHLIPRRKGDMEDPRGGVRHVIPERGNYKLWK
jgi:ATP adenylyltransferase|tara:strand:+ start:1987 stop:2376 length:390 start_codon:yes stop_codon:yes gene_type:complete